jgi:peptidoglycan/LPS O-acetylase OafA/YrhL
MELQMSANGVEVHQQQQKFEFNSQALNGLRGLMSVIILLHHSLHRGVDINIYGHVQMPLFFLLSGFCLTLGYGKSFYSSTTLCCCCCLATTKCDCRPCKKVPSENDPEVFDSWKFFKGRMTRILPVYYLTFIMGAILIPFGHGSASPSDIGQSGVGVIFSFLLIQSWFIHA